MEHGATSWLTFCANVTSHQFHQLFANGESQARPSIFSSRRPIRLHKWLEQLGEGAGGNPNSIVRDRKPDVYDPVVVA